MSLRVKHEENIGRIWDSSKFGVEIILTAPDDSESQTVYGEYHRHFRSYDPETNLPVITDSSSIGLRLSDLTVTPVKGWKVQVNDITGATINGVIVDSGDKDRTIGFVIFLFQRIGS